MSTHTIAVSRRRFLISTGAAGAGLSLGMMLPIGAHAAKSEKQPDEVNAWVVIHPDDTVVVRIARSEMGQGTLTGLVQMVAEELECNWDNVSWEYPTPGQSLERNRVWGNFSTGGSQGIRGSEKYVREGGAIARTLLVEAGANKLKDKPADCYAENGYVISKRSKKKVRFGEIASDAAQLVPPTEVTLKDPKDWKLIGKPIKRLDTQDKLNGKQVYGADLKLPGMLNASIKACPVFGGTVASFDESKVMKLPGVKSVVKVDDNAVAVIADTWWQAKTALDQLPIKWNEGPNANVSQADIEKSLTEGLTSDKDVFVGNENGDVNAGLKSAAKVVEATYHYPYQNHATMEPMNATAKWTKDRCEVWCPTQNGETALAAAADAAGLPQEQCDVYKIHLGGGFGRRASSHDYVRQSVLIAKAMPGTPIKLLWTREEDMQHGHYHPVTKARMVGGLNKEGYLDSLHMRISGQSIVAAIFPNFLKDGKDPFVFQGMMAEGDQAISYGIKNLLVDHAMRNPHVPPGFWRGVNANQNMVYMESFLDELAEAGSKDPLDFRRNLMKDHPKSLAVLEAVAKKSGWGQKSPKGIHRGLAVCNAFGSYVAACAEVSVDKSGAVVLERIVAATDPGHAVNPQQIEAQVSGSFVYGLSAMLYGECTVKDGHIEQSNFHDFPSLKIAQMPKVDTIVMPSGGFWGGVGEPTIAVAAPAVLNAIYAATGKRVRQLPLTKYSDVKIA
ncbi:xanthine dehydrogenase family protein molybdopterin-binding subunit [Marinibactrum halimedae]|uniref:Aldehyde dehydrogenase n=1 Tax=Marinibactrum halimedae TaxID=1444977 RepID=A0AA37WP28_9GAMM|nr:molybdopterin cofactor-binding domain-containing protein [Marinibactrum halimedae]MCD9460974.1 molybdopterin-dependent oxidoreductase [Marinibactrum halimedae]GLS28083.1 aldehyde dehydrogenase [Marinibactrum halimedae]